MENNTIYGGFSGIELELESFDLGLGIVLRKTYAHMFSPFMMAFKPKGKYGFNDGPWKATKGGSSFDITIEIEIPYSKKYEQEEVIWLIAALIRIGKAPYMSIPAISNMSFNSIVNSDVEPNIIPFETTDRIFSPNKDSKSLLDKDDLFWLKEYWQSSLQLIKKYPKFGTAFKAFDSATIKGKTSSSLLSIWGAIEQIFAPTPGELRFRVASYLSSFLTEPGEKRYKLYKDILRLYNDRSAAAHTSKDIDYQPLIESFVHMRNALVKMIENKEVPNQEELEKNLFICELKIKKNATQQ